jgi:hypothetical protein
MKRQKREKSREEKPLSPGTGALCAEAQADGVPCHELGRDCEVCGRAVTRGERVAPELPSDMA